MTSGAAVTPPHGPPAIPGGAPGASPKLYAIKSVPSSVLIDPQGRMPFTHARFRDDGKDALEARIRAALPPRAN